MKGSGFLLQYPSSIRLPALMFVALVAAGGCSADKAETSAGSAQLMASTIHGITVRGAWARVADSAATTGAYMTLVNNSDETVEISGASSVFADAVEIHETMDHDGIMHMMPLGSIYLSSGDSLVMSPGGVHMMLIRLHDAVADGDSIPLQLQLRDGESIPLMLPVRVP